jgi:hypothetical protein
MVHLHITSNPSQLELFSDEAMIGKTPLDLEWEKGRLLHLTLKADGYLPETRTLAPEADFGFEVVLKPVPKRPARPAEPSSRDDELKDAPY